jgi:stearoyl-CoA desaturase (Delta-9 desaturase)
LLIHVAGAAGVVWIVLNPSLATLALTGAFYVACVLAVTAGYHRLFAHRTYRPAAAVRWALLAFGAATFQNSAPSWSADHRAHHADTDGSGDPHPVTRGA